MQKPLLIITISLLLIDVSSSHNNYSQQIETKSPDDSYLNKLYASPTALNRKRVRRKTNDSNSNRMHYPDEPCLKNEITSKNCSFGLCQEVENYPSEKIQKLISRSLNLQDYFANQPPTVDIFSRLPENVENLCATKTHTFFPKSAMNTNGEEQLLINVGDYKQGVKFETCVNVDKPCKFDGIFPDGYESFCMQKYSVRRLMSIGKDSDQPIFDNFQMPSCCLCYVRKK